MAAAYLISYLAVILYFMYWTSYLVKHVRAAQKTGLPYMILPTTFWNTFYSILLSSRISHYILNYWLPQWLSDVVNYTDSVGRWTVKDRMFGRMGGCYLRVSPTRIVLDVGDADVIRQIFSNRHQFPKPIHQYGLLMIYGPNIVASGNDDWPRHRRHASPAFNEKNNHLVWEDAVTQAAGMLEEWRGGPTTDPEYFDMSAVRPYISRLILQVMASAGFGVPLPYRDTANSSESKTLSTFADSTTPPPGYSFTFRAVLQYMNVNLRSAIFAVTFVPQWIPRRLLPFSKQGLQSYQDLKQYMYTLIDVAKANDAQGRGNNNLLQLLVRSNEQKKDTEKDYRLNSEEILGNVHMFTVAGFETTATTLRFALVLLALHPEKQRWLRQGIKKALEDQPEDPEEWSYTEVFPKLVAPLCVMMETLRLYPPVVTVPKWADNGTPDIEYNGKTYTLPAETNINLNLNAVHYREAYWGPDVESFVPERWDATNDDSFLAQNKDVDGLVAAGLESPALHKPIRGAYAPFSDGSRSCLGKKFAQVEFTAILAIIFRDYEVCLARGSPGESDEQAAKRAWKSLNDSSTVVTLAMGRDVPLSFRKSRV